MARRPVRQCPKGFVSSGGRCVKRKVKPGSPGNIMSSGKPPYDPGDEVMIPPTNVLMYDWEGMEECFIAGTKVLLPDNSYKNIEDIKVGDYVKSFNIEANTPEEVFEDKQVTNLLNDVHTGKDGDHTIIMKFSDGSQNHNTTTNPYWVINKGDGGTWATFDVERHKKLYGWDCVKIEVGDYCLKFEDGNFKEVQLVSIEEVFDEIETFNIIVEDNHNYFAENILVHNKGFGPPMYASPGCWSCGPAASQGPPWSCACGCYPNNSCSDWEHYNGGFGTGPSGQSRRWACNNCGDHNNNDCYAVGNECRSTVGCTDYYACNYDNNAGISCNSDGCCTYPLDVCGSANRWDDGSATEWCSGTVPGLGSQDECDCEYVIDHCGQCRPNYDHASWNDVCVDCCGVPNGGDASCDGCCGPCQDNLSCLDDCGQCWGDNSTCLGGCNEPGACNYNSYAMYNDGSCVYYYDTCLDPTAYNYQQGGCCFWYDMDTEIGFARGGPTLDNFGGVWLRLNISFDDKPERTGWAIIAPGHSCWRSSDGNYESGADVTGEEFFDINCGTYPCNDAACTECCVGGCTGSNSCSALDGNVAACESLGNCDEASCCSDCACDGECVGPYVTPPDPPGCSDNLDDDAPSCPDGTYTSGSYSCAAATAYYGFCPSNCTCSDPQPAGQGQGAGFGTCASDELVGIGNYVIWNSGRQLGLEFEGSMNHVNDLDGYDGSGFYPSGLDCGSVEHYFQLPAGQYQLIMYDVDGDGFGRGDRCSNNDIKYVTLAVSDGDPYDDNNWEELVHIVSNTHQASSWDCQCHTWSWLGTNCEAEGCDVSVKETEDGTGVWDGDYDACGSCHDMDTNDAGCVDDARCKATDIMHDASYWNPIDGTPWGGYGREDVMHHRTFDFDVEPFGCTFSYDGTFCPWCGDECPNEFTWCQSCESGSPPPGGGAITCQQEGWVECFSPGIHAHDIANGLSPGDPCPMCCPEYWLSQIQFMGCYDCNVYWCP